MTAPLGAVAPRKEVKKEGRHFCKYRKKVQQTKVYWFCLPAEQRERRRTKPQRHSMPRWPSCQYKIWHNNKFSKDACKCLEEFLLLPPGEMKQEAEKAQKPIIGSCQKAFSLTQKEPINRSVMSGENQSEKWMPPGRKTTFYARKINYEASENVTLCHYRLLMVLPSLRPWNAAVSALFGFVRLSNLGFLWDSDMSFRPSFLPSSFALPDRQLGRTTLLCLETAGRLLMLRKEEGQVGL